MVPGPTSPGQEPGWGQEGTEQNSGVLTITSGQKQRKDVSRPSREKLHVPYSLWPGPEGEADEGSLPQLTAPLGYYVPQ